MKEKHENLVTLTAQNLSEFQVCLVHLSVYFSVSPQLFFFIHTVSWSAGGKDINAKAHARFIGLSAAFEGCQNPTQENVSAHTMKATVMSNPELWNHKI